MKLKNKFIALMLLLCSTQTHKPMSLKNDLFLSSLLNDDSCLSSSTGETMFTESFALEYQDYYEAFTDHNSSTTPVLSEPLGSINTTLNVEPLGSTDIAPEAASKPSTKKRKHDFIFSCDHCGLKKESDSELQRHIASHVPVATVCPFDNCRKELLATLQSMEMHFWLKHKQECAALKKSVFQLASETYHSALKTQEDIVHRTVQPIQREPRQASQVSLQISSIIGKNTNQTVMQLSDTSNTRAPEVNSTLPYNEPVDRSDFELHEPLPLAALPALLAQGDSYFHSLLNDGSAPPLSTGAESMPTRACIPGFQPYYTDLTDHNPLPHSQSGLTNTTLNALPTPTDMGFAQAPPTSAIKNRAITCPHCDLTFKWSSSYRTHISTHFPVTTSCPFYNCPKPLRATIASLRMHFAKKHGQECKSIKKSLSQMATETYNAAIERANPELLQPPSLDYLPKTLSYDDPRLSSSLSNGALLPFPSGLADIPAKTFLSEGNYLFYHNPLIISCHNHVNIPDANT